jgi:hypothetical protein
MQELLNLWSQLQFIYPGLIDIKPEEVTLELVATRFEDFRVSLSEQEEIQALNEFFAEVFPKYLEVLFPPVISHDDEPSLTGYQGMLQRLRMVSTLESDTVISTVPATVSSTDTMSILPVTSPSLSTEAPAEVGWRQRLILARAANKASMTPQAYVAIHGFDVKGFLGEQNQQRIKQLQDSLQRTVPTSAPVTGASGSVSQLRQGLEGRPLFAPGAPLPIRSTQPSAEPAKPEVDSMTTIDLSDGPSVPPMGFFAPQPRKAPDAPPSASTSSVSPVIEKTFKDKLSLAITTGYSHFMGYHGSKNKATYEFNRGKGNALFSFVHYPESEFVQARGFNAEFLRCQTEQDMVDCLDRFLNQDNTSYHWHSLASYLIDEAKEFLAKESQALSLPKTTNGKTYGYYSKDTAPTLLKEALDSVVNHSSNSLVR